MAVRHKLVVVSSYPSHGSVHGNTTVGVASYTKQLLETLAHNHPVTPHVYAEKLPDEPSITEENGVAVRRVWNRGSLRSILSLFGELRTTGKETPIFVSFELYMFGGALNGIFFLLSLGVLKMIGKEIIILVHQAPRDIETIGFSRLLAPLLFCYPWFLSAVATALVVMEDALRSLFPRFAQVTVIPHLVPRVNTVSRASARRRLGWSETGKYLLYFGYITYYKGIDRLIAVWPEDSDWHLVVAGGINPNHVANPAVSTYIQSVTDAANKKGIVVTGFVDEDSVADYFSAADAVVLPYRGFMSSSGPLSLAWAYEKPVLMSHELRNYFESSDIADAARAAGIEADDLFIEMSSTSLRSSLSTLHNPRFLQFTRRMNELRSPDKIVQAIYHLFAKRFT